MIRKPLYVFDNENSTGLDKVPVNAACLVENYSGEAKFFLLKDKTSLDQNTTISTLLTTYVSQTESLDTTYTVGDGGLTQVNFTTADNAKLDSLAAFTYLTKTTTYTAVAFDYIYADTTSASFTITLPATPNAQDRVTILDSTGNFGTNNLTVARNGETIMGLAEDIILDVDNKEYRFIYTGTDWRVAQ